MEPQPLPLGRIDDQYNTGQTLEIMPAQRRRHMALFGSSGTGKSTLMHNMIVADIHNDQGVIVIDPHGDLIEGILEVIPRRRSHEVVYFNPSDPTHSIGINIFESVPREQRHLVAESFVTLFKKIWGESWGPRMENIMRYSAYALASSPRPVSIVHLPLFLTNAQYRAQILSFVDDPIILNFFRSEFDAWDQKFRNDAIQPILNKIGAFVAHPILRSIIGQTTPKVDFRTALDRGNIILCKSSKADLGEEASTLLSSLLAMKVTLAAISRQNIPERERRLCFFYIDEAHNIHGAHLDVILQETRKYGLILIPATQMPSQYEEKTRFAVLSNCASVVSFRVSGADVETLKPEFDMWLPASLLKDLPNYKAFVRSMFSDRGRPARPLGFSVLTDPAVPPQRGDSTSDRIIRESRARFARPRAVIEQSFLRHYSRRIER